MSNLKKYIIIIFLHIIYKPMQQQYKTAIEMKKPNGEKYYVYVKRPYDSVIPISSIKENSSKKHTYDPCCACML